MTIVADKRPHHRRVNPNSRAEHKDGFTRCPHPTCRLWIPDARLPDDPEVPWSCPRGHTYTWRELEEKAFGEPGGWTHAQLSPTAQGVIGEQVVEAVGKLGRHAVAGMTPANDTLDGWTDTGFGIEVKSVNAEARNVAFVAGTVRAKRRKDDVAKERGYRGILAVLVVLDFRTSVASIYMREMEHIRYFIPAVGEEPLAIVGFDNPFTKEK